MDLIIDGKQVFGTVKAPPSKSHTHRAFIMASLCAGETIVSHPLWAQDTISTLDAMCSMGAQHRKDGESIHIVGSPLHAPNGIVDVGNSGTSMRILTGIASTLDVPVTISGDKSILKRPMFPLLNALRDLGASYESQMGLPPVKICGPLQGGRTNISGNMSSQFITSLLMSAPLAKKDVNISVIGNMVSRPYVDVTLKMMSDFGIQFQEKKNEFHVPAGQNYHCTEYTVPGDFSSAAFPLAAGALAGEVTVTGLDLRDPQGDKAILDILRQFGAEVKSSANSVTVTQSKLEAIELDMGNIPDLFPITAVLAATASGETRLYGAPQLRFKESDRISHTASMLKNMGAQITETEDGCIIRGVTQLHGSWIDPVDDHRLMMAASIASLVSEGPMTIKDGECHMISYPNFLKDISTLGMKWRLDE